MQDSDDPADVDPADRLDLQDQSKERYLLVNTSFMNLTSARDSF